MEDPPKNFFRLSPGKEVRLKYAYYINCAGVIKDPSTGEIVELRCEYDPATRGGWSEDGRKVRGTSHWVSARHCAPAEFRLYDRLFTKPNPDEGEGYLANLNPASLETLRGFIEKQMLNEAQTGIGYQFERQGYFCADPDSRPEAPVFNRSVSLKDSWRK